MPCPLDTWVYPYDQGPIQTSGSLLPPTLLWYSMRTTTNCHNYAHQLFQKRAKKMRRKLDVVLDEITAIRSRLVMKNWETTSIDADMRLLTLQKLIGSKIGNEIHRHVVVSLVSVLQTYHRGTVISIIKSDEIYKMRAAEIVTDKISLKDALIWTGGKTITFGELVAHSIPCNSVTDLVSLLGNILDCDIKKALSEAITPLDLRSRTKSPSLVIPDVNQLLANLDEAFKLRHILAHEAAPSVIIDAEKCQRLYDSIKQWTKGIRAILWATIYKDEPLTTAEMNKKASADVVDARDNLSRTMRKALSVARSDGRASWLRKNHFAWRTVTQDWTRGSYGSLEGTMWPAISGAELAQAIEARTKIISNWVSWNNFDEASHNDYSWLADT